MSVLTGPNPLPHTSHHVLSNSAEIVLRPLEPGDTDLVSEVFDGLGPESRYHRFLVPKLTLTSSDLRRLTGIDHRDHEAVVAISAVDGRAIGVGRFIRLRNDPDTAEVAVTVVDAWQRRGVGGILTEALVARAQSLHVRKFAIFMARANAAAAQLTSRLPGSLECIAYDRQTAEFVVTLTRTDRHSDFRSTVR